MKRIVLMIFCLLIIGIVSFAQLTGTKTIPGNYPTIASAITDLNNQGVGTGGVIFMIQPGFTETFLSLSAGLITATGTQDNPIVFQKSGAGNNPLIKAATGTAATTEYIIGFRGSDFVTFDGINLADSTGSVEWGYALLKSSGIDGAQTNTIKNCTITMNKNNTASTAIYANNVTPANPTTQLTVTSLNGTNSYNKIFANTIPNSYNGISFSGFNDLTSPYQYYDQNNEIGVDGANTISNFGGGAAANNGIYAAYQNNLKIANNSISGPSAGAGQCSGIQVGTCSNSNLFIFSNSVSIAYNGTGKFYGIFDNHGNVFTSATLVDIHHNTVSNCTFPTAAKIDCQYFYINGGGATCRFHHNVATNNVYGSSTAVATGVLTGIYHNGNQNISGNLLYYDNQVTNITRIQSVTGSGITYYMWINGGMTLVEMYNNLVDNNIVASNGDCYGIRALNSSVGAKFLYNNTVTNLLNANGKLEGISSSNSTGTTIYNNKVLNLNALGTSSTVVGINLSTLLSPGGNMYCYNNFVGDLKAPASSLSYAIYGIQGNGSQVQTMGIYNNTVYLNASSSGANFGTYGIYLTYLPVTIELKNNISINTSMCNGTGMTAALGYYDNRCTNYALTSNNNDFYAGTPGLRNLIFYAGSIQDQTLQQFQSRFAPGESNSISEIPPFMNTATATFDLHLNSTVPTQAESGGVTVSVPNIIYDFDIESRYPNTGYPENPSYSPIAPDMGADEFAGIFLDIKPPVVNYTTLSNTSSYVERTLVATITDRTGVPDTGIGLPRLAWKKNFTGSWNYVTGAPQAGNQFGFNFGTGVVEGDTIYYYILAQDVVTPPNIGASPAAGAAGFNANPPTASVHPASPDFYAITPSGIVNNTVVQNTTIISGQDTCFNARQQIVVAGNGYGFVVQSGGSAVMIAGNSIRYLPGTVAESGSYMHGYITETNDYCASLPASFMAIKSGKTEYDVVDNDLSFRVYPNPTSGLFSIRKVGKPDETNLKAEIFGMNGMKIFSVEFNDGQQVELSLANSPAGIYFVRITHGSQTEIQKLVKW